MFPTKGLMGVQLNSLAGPFFFGPVYNNGLTPKIGSFQLLARINSDPGVILVLLGSQRR